MAVPKNCAQGIKLKSSRALQAHKAHQYRFFISETVLAQLRHSDRPHQELNPSPRRVRHCIPGKRRFQHHGVKQLHRNPRKDQSRRRAETKRVEVFHDRPEVCFRKGRFSFDIVYHLHFGLLRDQGQSVFLKEPQMPLWRRWVRVQVRQPWDPNQGNDPAQKNVRKWHGRRPKCVSLSFG